MVGGDVEAVAAPEDGDNYVMIKHKESKEGKESGEQH